MPAGFGLISCQRTHGDPRSWEDLYREALDLTQAAESMGFGSVWTTEHHFVDDGYMPSLLPMSAAMAALTERIEIGTGVLLAPLYHPLRLAEDAATVSILSGGRFTLGLGLGWSPVEFAGLGAGLAERGRAMDEILRILPQAWSGDIVTHREKVYDLPEVALRPVPQKAPPIVIGGTVDAAVRRAARLSDGFFSNASRDRFLHQVALAREVLAEAGRSEDSFRWLYYALVYPCADPSQGWERIRDHVWAVRWKYSDMEASAGRKTPVPPPPRLDEATEARIRSTTILGPPEHIAQQLGDVREAAGVPVEFMFRSYFPGLSHAEQIAIMEALAEVLPHLD